MLFPAKRSMSSEISFDVKPPSLCMGGFRRFKQAGRHRDLHYIDAKDVEFKEVIEAPLPRAPLDSVVVSHWLAIEGVHPAIPENAPLACVIYFSANSFNSADAFDSLQTELSSKLSSRRRKFCPAYL